VDGGDVELDREMIEMIRDPLTHMVRNAIDHGIEPTAERVAAGKPAAGTLTVCARQSGNQILIEVADDGRGVDGDRLVTKALANGVITAERAERLTAAQKNALMFEAGLSTAQAVTAISGRGVGMDVVRANIERIGGLIEIESKLGKGVRFTIRVPLTLTIIPALTVSACGQTFAVPRAAIEEILRAGGAAVRMESLGDSFIATIRGRRMPLVTLASLLGHCDVEPTAVTRSSCSSRPAARSMRSRSTESTTMRVGREARGSRGDGRRALRRNHAGDDGRPVLLLDPSGMAAKGNIHFEAQEEQGPGRSEPAAPRRRSGPAPAVPGPGRRQARHSPAGGRTDRRCGGRRRPPFGRTAAGDGRRAHIAARRLQRPSGDGEGADLRLSDGAAELAYAFAEVIDILPLTGEVREALGPGEVGGVVLVGGDQVELLDPYWLFEQAGAAAAEPARLVCAIPAGDAWMENMLRPLIESLGYQVVPAGDGVQADIVIASAEAPPPPAPAGRRFLRLRTTAQAGADSGGTIYRYDRAALLDALGGAGKRGQHG
jgi:two-component system chemotaxis sensor kinase CheA